MSFDYSCGFHRLLVEMFLSDICDWKNGRMIGDGRKRER
jgi:hypothetical protein